ncbi:MAG: M23 family metallopeptidase [Xanthobacteraceae bacterium]|nr:M23 family metallopeptidase [Xanthobacteraceae bacterium]
MEGARAALIDRRRVSVQWFSGTILTGLCGAALMGGAVYIALDGEAHFAAVAERAEAALRGSLAGERPMAVARKSDRLPTVSETNSARQVVRVSSTYRAGDRELVRVVPYVRVASNLALSASELSARIPPYNPQRVLAETARAASPTDEPPAAEPDAEVSFVTRELTPLLPRLRLAVALRPEDVMARVRDAAEWSGSSAARPMVAGLGAGSRLAFAAEPAEDPYAGFEARIIPENITLLPKTGKETTGGNSWNERIVMVRKNETIATILADLGATPDEIRAIAGALGSRGRAGGIREGQKLRILLAPAEAGGRQMPLRVVVAGESAIEAVVALSDTGRYVAVDVQHMGTEVAEAEEDDGDASTVRLYHSVYETALRNQVPRMIIDEIIRIYSYDVDFQRRTQPGDSFEVFFAGEEDTPQDLRNEVLYAALTVGGETRKYFRFQSPDDGVVDYYDETGKSAKKFLVRKPLADGVMRSGYGWRKHPILGYGKMHTGVDWAAARGTPIYAAGNGTIEKAGWESGYGKYVRIRHTNGYETAYAHMTAHARGIEPGKRVRQGQVIGFVGSTGLSTGAHLHYEIMVNGRYVDPMRIRLPRGRVLEGPMLAGFERERDRIEALIQRRGSRVAGR